MKVRSMNGQMEKLIREEGLDDLDRLLTPREWDEGKVSRYPVLT